MNFRRYTCWQVSVVTLWSLMELWGGWWMIIVFWNSFNHTTHLFNEPWNWSNHSLVVILTKYFLQCITLERMDQFLQTGYHLNPLFPENKTVRSTSCLNKLCKFLQHRYHEYFTWSWNMANIPSSFLDLPSLQFNCLQYEKQMTASYPGTIFPKHLVTIASFHCCRQYLHTSTEELGATNAWRQG